MRTRASSATLRASATEAFVGLGSGPVAPRLRRLRPLALWLHLDELHRTVTGADDQTVDHARCGIAGGDTGAEHLEPLPAERRPRASQPYQPMDVGGRPGPVDRELGGIDLRRV